METPTSTRELIGDERRDQGVETRRDERAAETADATPRDDAHDMTQRDDDTRDTTARDETTERDDARDT